jgi:uncharacterized lipoprotein NlpE involved in copper resistance
MKKTTLSFSLLFAVLAVLGLNSCSTQTGDNKSRIDTHTSRMSLDWDGAYTGIIPSASGSGISVLIVLNQNGTFEIGYSYVDKPEHNFTQKGSFKWDKTGEIIILKVKDMPPYYKAASNKLIQLDMNGKYITGALAENYILEKIIPPNAAVNME